MHLKNSDLQHESPPKETKTPISCQKTNPSTEPILKIIPQGPVGELT